jgi:hypothetical protein
VMGIASKSSGVVGFTNDGTLPAGWVAGVMGVAPVGLHGVQAVAGTPSAPAPIGTGTVGVGGYSSSGVGVVGTSTSNHGVVGVSSSRYGVLGNSTNGVGLGGNSNYIGLFGQGNGNAFGVQGESHTGIGIYAISNGPTGTGLYASSANGYAARFQGTVLVSGAFSQTGGPKSALVPHADGLHRRVYCQESPEPWFEDFGEARLRSGRAVVQLDEEFDAEVRGDNYRVFLTPEGDCKGLYVIDKRPHRFEVRELQSGTSELTFSYRVVARRRDIDGPRLEKVRLPEHQVPRQAPPMPVAPAADPTRQPGDQPRR